jgi:hypothetical protein
MALRTNLRLTLPAVLGVTGLAAGCPGEDGDDDATSVANTDTGGSSGAATSDDSSGTNASTTTSATDASGTSAADAESTSRADSGSESITDSGGSTGSGCALGGGGPTCDVITEQGACEAEEICLWAPPGYCYANCTVIADEASCCAEPGCLWFDGACDYGGI